MSKAFAPVKVFCAYAHADEPLRQALENHVSAMKHQGLISVWHDGLIAPGMDEMEEVVIRLNGAALILLLISPAFLASDICYRVVMERALERHRCNDAWMIPILVRPVDWQGTSFASLQMLPTGAKPVTLWENQDAAWLDVVSGIRTVIGKLLRKELVETSRVGYIPIWNVPHRRNPFFTGREEILAHLHATFRHNQTVGMVQALTGLGGIGKTQVATEYAYRYRSHYQGIFWVGASSADALKAGFVFLAALFGLPEQQEQHQDIIVQAVKHWLSNHRNWLLILDNVDLLEMIVDFLPTDATGDVLLTTRKQALGTIAHGIEVEKMSLDEGILFLLLRTKMLAPGGSLHQASKENLALAAEIIEALGGLPLALDQAGAYIEETHCGLSQYLHLYRTHRRELLLAARRIYSGASRICCGYLATLFRANRGEQPSCS